MTASPSSDEPELEPKESSGELSALRPFGDELDDVEGEQLLARLEAALFRRETEPRTLGRWLILERRGAGAMGVVYAAYDPRLARRVALKVLRTGRAGRSDARARMLREAQALAKISDPHVLHIYDVEELEGNVCLVMELIEGSTLEVWQRQPRSFGELLDRYIAVAHGLAKIHDAGLVHRDVKPSNVLVDGTRVVIADFGLVLAEDDVQPGARPTGPVASRSALELSLTEDGALVGTLGYMAPELLAGEGATARSDQFAFCVSLYEALTGGRPFRGATPRAVAEAMTVAPLPRAPRGVPLKRWIHRILQRGLAVDPDLRFGSMTEVEAALVRGRDRGRAARTLALVVVAGAGLAALGYGLGGQHEAIVDPVARCEARVAERPEIWADRHAALVERVRTQARDVEVAAWEDVARIFEAEDGRLRAERLEACVGAASPQASAAALRRGAASHECLDAKEIELRAYAEALVDADALPELPELERLRARLIALPDCRALADEDAQRREASEPAESMAILNRARAQDALGEHREVEQLAATLLDSAREQGLARLEGEAEYLRGRALLVLGRPLDARRSLETGLRAAARANERELAARTAVMLVKVVANDLQDAAGGRGWLRVADHELLASGELDRQGPLYTDYVMAQGLVAYTEKDYAEAEARLRAALARQLELGDAVPVGEVLKTKNNLANALRRLGRGKESHVLLREALAEAEERYGPQHPHCADIWINIGKLHQGEGRLELAARAYRRAVDIDLPRRDIGGLPALRSLLALGHVAQLEGDASTLVETAAQVVAVHETLRSREPEAMSHVDRADELRLVALARLEQGDVDGAAGAMRDSAVILELHDAVEAALTRLDLARVLIEHEREAEARSLLEEALPPLQSTDPQAFAEAQSLLERIAR